MQAPLYLYISRARHYAENISILHGTALQLSTRPDTHPMYKLRLYPLSLERSAILAQLETEEKHAIESAQIAYDEERERVEEEWRRGRERVRERLVEGIEERRRRAREEKEGEGTIGGLLPLFRGSSNILTPIYRHRTRCPISTTYHTEITQQTRHISTFHTTWSAYHQ